MIRRWSCVIAINNNFSNSNLFKKKFKINLFKSSVNLKRASTHYTKFKRKALIRIKHQNNFLIYTNIIKFWIKDYLFNKNYLKFQFFNKIFLHNYSFFNISLIKLKNNEISNNFNFIFSNFTNKNISYFIKFKSLNFFKFLPSSVCFFDNHLIKPNCTLPSYRIYDDVLYFNNDVNFNTSDVSFIFNDVFELLLKKITEIRKILIILIFYKIKIKIASKTLNNFVAKPLFFKKIFFYVRRF